VIIWTLREDQEGAEGKLALLEEGHLVEKTEYTSEHKKVSYQRNTAILEKREFGVRSKKRSRHSKQKEEGIPAAEKGQNGRGKNKEASRAGG